MIRILFLLVLVLALPSLHAFSAVDLVIVNKSEKRMYLMENDQVLKKYKIALGANPVGHKTQEGDEKTPEGLYKLDYINEQSSFYRSMHISYPNEEDVKRAEDEGVPPGGAIMVHGQKNGWGWIAYITQMFNWTNGCIAIRNKQMDEFIELVPVGTPIQINK